MSAQAGPSRLGRTSDRTQARHISREETVLSDLVARLSLQDIEVLERQQNGTDRHESQLSDADLALRLFAEDARSLVMFNIDRALAMSLNDTGERAFEDLPAAPATPRQARTDIFARTQPLNVTSPPPQAHNFQQRLAVRVPDQKLASWGEWFATSISWVFGLSQESPTPSTAHLTIVPTMANRQLALTGHNCVICQDPIRGGQIRAPCGHYYDIACVTDLFDAATRDESLFPPRCCRQHISFDSVRIHLTAGLVALFIEKRKEFGTLKRVYCAKSSCSRFLGPEKHGFFAFAILCSAPGCGTRTCPSCKAEAVNGLHQCKADASDEQLIALGRGAGWARCPGCAQMIELNLGCYHMTCRCSTQFCYLCTERWKTCTCPQWDEQRLVAAAEERVNLQIGRRRPVAVAAQPVRVARAQPVRAVPILLPVPMVNIPPAARAPEVQGNVTRGLAPLTASNIARHAMHAGTATTAATAQETRPVLGQVGMMRDQRVGIPLHRSDATPAVSTQRMVNQTPFNWRPQTSVGTINPRSQGRNPAPAKDYNANVRARLVREAVERLRVDHDCQHDKWKYRSGGGRCQTCSHDLPLYLFRCTGCETLACNRCRRNRL